LLNPGEWGRSTPADAAKRGEGGADLRDLQCCELRCTLAEQESGKNLVLGQLRTAAQLELRRVGEPRDVQRRRRIGGRRARGEVRRRVDLAFQSGPVEAHSPVSEVQLFARERESTADEFEAAADPRVVGGITDVQVAAELCIQPATLHEYLSRGVQPEIEADH